MVGKLAANTTQRDTIIHNPVDLWKPTTQPEFIRYVIKHALEDVFASETEPESATGYSASGVGATDVTLAGPGRWADGNSANL